MKIVACLGYKATLTIAKSRLIITQFEPVDISGYTKTAIKNSNLADLLQAKFVEEYTDQVLPEKTNTKVQIPVMKQVVESGNKNTQVKFEQSMDGKRVVTKPDIPAKFSEKLTSRVESDKEARLQDLNQVNADVVGVDNINENNIKKLTEKELTVPATVVGGKPVKDFKFPVQAKRKKGPVGEGENPPVDEN